MANPEGYRKALRVMKMAEKVPSPGSSPSSIPPGPSRGDRPPRSADQSEAIARNLLEMSHLKTPIVVAVIGEGGSGGALAIGVDEGDEILMMEYSVLPVHLPRAVRLDPLARHGKAEGGGGDDEDHGAGPEEVSGSSTGSSRRPLGGRAPPIHKAAGDALKAALA